MHIAAMIALLPSFSRPVKVDMVQTEQDPLMVTSQVLGGFVVIDAPQSPTSTTADTVKLLFTII